VTLEKDSRPHPDQSGVIFQQHFLEGKSRCDCGGIFEKGIFRKVFGGAGGNNGHSMLQDPALPSLFNHGLEIARKTFHFADFSVEIHVDPVIFFDLLNEVPKVSLDIFSTPGFVEGKGVSPEPAVTLHEVCLVALFRKIPGCLHTGYSSSDDKSILVDIEHRFCQRL